MTGRRLCRWPACGVEVAASRWGCDRHWRMLPELIQKAISQAYRPGQESSSPSRDYVRACKAAVDFIRLQDPWEQTCRFCDRRFLNEDPPTWAGADDNRPGHLSCWTKRIEETRHA